MSTSAEIMFTDLNLPSNIQSAIASRGYTIPTPIQAQIIPYVLDGRDVLGQASTGTGKTAAFALPLLARLDLNSRLTQVIVLCPTRELAIQVANSFADYGDDLPGLNVLPIYGGASYYNQIKELKRGAQVVVGTPGRVMDHMRRGTLNLENLQCLVLDEADEMLRMGFVDDVKWILEQTPAERQVALFSATMPDPIRRIANEHLKNPATITIRSETKVADTIRSRYLVAPFREKTGALIRILETEKTEGVIVFAKTKETTLRVADELLENGYSAIAINGDIVQKQREHTIEQLRSGKLDILVATDVAARGLDVQRISHVINYDIPHDSEAWIHRIGRTGRAGRQGEAILFLTPAERRHLRSLERATRQTIVEMEFPSAKAVNERRKADLQERLLAATTAPQFDMFKRLLSEIQESSGMTAEDLLGAVGVLMQGDRPFFMKDSRRENRPVVRARESTYDARGDRFGHSQERVRGRGADHDRGPRGGDRGLRGPRSSERCPRGVDVKPDRGYGRGREENRGYDENRGHEAAAYRGADRGSLAGRSDSGRPADSVQKPDEAGAMRPPSTAAAASLQVTDARAVVASAPAPSEAHVMAETQFTAKAHVTANPTANALTTTTPAASEPVPVQPVPVQPAAVAPVPAMPVPAMPSRQSQSSSSVEVDSFATRDFTRPPVTAGSVLQPAGESRPFATRPETTRRDADRGSSFSCGDVKSRFGDASPRRSDFGAPESRRPDSRDRDSRDRDSRRAEGREFEPRGSDARRSKSEPGMETFRLEVGHEHGVQPGNIVGAIANEAGIDSKNIGRINIQDDHCFVDLPVGMPIEIFRGLKDVVVMGRHLRISKAEGYGPPTGPGRARAGQGRAGQARAGQGRPAFGGGSRDGSRPPHRREEGFDGGDRAARPAGGQGRGSHSKPSRGQGGVRGKKSARGPKFRS